MGLNFELLKKHKVWIGLISIIIFGFVFRIYALGDSNLWVDEAISSLAARNIWEKGIPKFDSGAFYERALVFHYLVALSTTIFYNDLGARLISVFFGLGSAVLVFFIAREFSSENEKIRNNTAGLVAALFSAVLFLEVVYSRQARFYQMFQFFFFLTLFFLYKSKDKDRQNKKYAWLACFSLTILVNTHLAGIIIAPLFFYLFIKEQKDWKLFIIPIIISLYYAPSLLGINYGDTKLAGSYVESYSSSLFYHLRAFGIITLLGLPFGFYWNKRLTLILIIPSIVLLISLFFVKVYALRYAYFIVLLAPIFIGVLFSYIYKNNKLFFSIILIAAVLYPSNLFFDSGYLTVIRPEDVQLFTSSEPIIGYKDLSQNLKVEIINSNNVVLFTPAFAWYYKNPDYFIPFSLNGLSSGYTLYNGIDIYTGSKIFNLEDPQLKEFILVEDAFGYSKLNSSERAKVDALKRRCEFIEEARFLKVYRCK